MKPNDSEIDRELSNLEFGQETGINMLIIVKSAMAFLIIVSG